MTYAFNRNCKDAMREFPDKFFDLASVDPPYGRGESGGRRRDHNVQQTNGSSLHVKAPFHQKKHWDTKPPDPEYFTELIRVSKHQIIWGVNYYPQVFGPGRIVWDKVNDGSDQSNCELAYCSLISKVQIFRYMWRGMMQGKSITEGHIMQGNKKLNEKLIHPTQKPVPLYQWCLSKFTQPGWRILDTHLGSGSQRIAADQLGLDFWGYEIDKQYFDMQEERFRQHISQTKLFTPCHSSAPAPPAGSSSSAHTP
jgi:site-specific DNA-methyltransferase (adenine-specific)